MADKKLADGRVKDARRHEYEAMYEKMVDKSDLYITCGWCSENEKSWRKIEDIKKGDIIVGWMTTQESKFYRDHRGNKRGIVSVGEVTEVEDIRKQLGFSDEYRDGVLNVDDNGAEKWIHFRRIFSSPPWKPAACDLSKWSKNTGIVPLKKKIEFILDKI
tara:strand:+ start:19 stop:498 length:480 start_codon:yes stop_codon:yes gene_type:complete